MPIETKEIDSKVVFVKEKELLICPKCKVNNKENTDVIKRVKCGCCGHYKYECTDCGFSAPLRIFILGKLPSEGNK